MNHNHITVDTLLRSITPPSFVNADHQEALRLRLNGLSVSELPAASRFAFRGRWTKAATVCALAIALVTAVVLAGPFFATKSVWAQARSAMETVQTAIVTFRFIPPDGVTPAPEAAAEQRAFVRAPNHFAVISPKRKGWFNGSEVLVYDTDLNQVTEMAAPGNVTGMLLDSFSSGQFPYQLFAPQYDHESDHGVVQFEGRTLRFIELWDSHDPTDRLEFYLETNTLLPVVQITWHRDDASAIWRQWLRADYAFNVPVDPQVFVPDYPASAKVVRQEPPTLSQSAQDGQQTTDSQGSTLGIARHGDKYVAITDVWVGESGWIGLKIRSNLHTVMEALLDVKGLDQFIKDPVNQERWPVDEQTLRNYLHGGKLTSDVGLTYLSLNGAMRSPHNKTLGDKEFSQFYHPCPSPPDVVYPKTLTFRLLANTTDKGRGESFEHYQDWTESPDKYQLFELTVPAPTPSNIPPDGFKEWDLEWWARTEVDTAALISMIGARRTAEQDVELYNRIHGLPEEKRLSLGVFWLAVLNDLGKEQEKRAFFEKYEPYAVKKWGDQAEERGNLKRCREIMARKPNS